MIFFHFKFFFFTLSCRLRKQANKQTKKGALGRFGPDAVLGGRREGKERRDYLQTGWTPWDRKPCYNLLGHSRLPKKGLGVQKTCKLPTEWASFVLPEK